MVNYVWLCALQLLHSAIYVYVNWMSHRGEAEVPFNISKLCYEKKKKEEWRYVLDFS